MYNIKDRFKSFLEEKGVLEAFDENVNCLTATSLDEFLNLGLSAYSWVRNAFLWNETSQGNRFWQTVEDEWYKILDGIK